MKQKYQILPRKYRPQKFNEVVGQDSVVTTLKNAIRLNRTAYAYLFSGSRGTGKTTLSRLFAKALNCHNLLDEIEPCCQCISCKEIASSRSLDVIEIDGASNRGIDDIRHINETIGYSPSSGKYKIYIIDEVHMLTKEAFNALLKTLEEPPPTIKFFFATTEPHKVLPTILSRCQRFDLMRISIDQIINKLTSISKDIQREIDDDAMHMIAHFSDGSLRDAESLLDQLLCYEEGKITTFAANNMLGLLPKDHFFQLDEAVKNSDTLFAFSLSDNLFQKGKDFNHFLEELIEHYRHHLITKIKNNNSHLPPYLQEKYKTTNSNYHEEQLFFILDLLMHSQQQMQKSPFKRVTLEMILLQIIRSSKRISMQSLVKRLIQLEQSIDKSSPIDNISQPKEQKKANEDIKLETVDFSVSKEKTKDTSVVTKKNQSHYDTLMHFAAIELEGTITKEGNTYGQ